MENDQLVGIELLCRHYHIEPSFIDALGEYGLIEICTDAENRYISKETVRDLERMVRMHHELAINLEGIDTIFHLLERMEHLQQEMNSLRNKLRFYENS